MIVRLASISEEKISIAPSQRAIIALDGFLVTLFSKQNVGLIPVDISLEQPKLFIMRREFLGLIGELLHFLVRATPPRNQSKQIRPAQQETLRHIFEP